MIAKKEGISHRPENDKREKMSEVDGWSRSANDWRELGSECTEMLEIPSINGPGSAFNG